MVLDEKNYLKIYLCTRFFRWSPPTICICTCTEHLTACLLSLSRKDLLYLLWHTWFTVVYKDFAVYRDIVVYGDILLYGDIPNNWYIASYISLRCLYLQRDYLSRRYYTVMLSIFVFFEVLLPPCLIVIVNNIELNSSTDVAW